jgi:hypothetical protein
VSDNSFRFLKTKVRILKLPTAVRIPLGAQVQKNRSTDNVERFLSLIRFENKEKLKELGWIYEKG